MRCPQCGTAVSPSASRCQACNRTLGAGVATAGLTPVPDTATVFLPPGRAERQPAQRARLSSDDDATRLGDLESPPTQVGIGGADGWPDEDSFIRLGDDDPAATRLLTPPGTRAPGKGDKSPRLGTSDSGPLKIGQGFGARYHIIRLLGIGGMGAVYQAWDAELGVVVAIKVIRPEAMADPSAAAEIERRFKRELLLARQVTHKNVVRIHDLGEVGGIKYITMPFVDGDDLATIAEAGRLPIAKVLRIARAVTSGLVAAHAAGVVHRDLKPANIMVDADDEAMIMDFGIARSTGGAAREATSWESMPSQIKRSMPAFADATTFGAVVGTVAYMAPEQAKGQSADQRADIYAFGLILYDLLVGRRRADHAVSSIAELQGRMEKAPPPPRSIEPDIPEAVDRIVTRCIEPDPAKRYQTTVELEAELNRLDAEGKPLRIARRLTKRLVAAAAALLLAVVGATYWLARGPVAPVQHEPLSVLIADFDNRANDPVFHGTVESALSIALEGASFITSYRREEAQRAVEQIQHGSTLSEANAILLAVREGIKVVLSGSIEPTGSGYTIVVKAIDPAVNKVLGSASAKASSKSEVLRAVGSLASNIRGSLGDETPASAKIGAAETVTAASLEALQDYTRGQELQINSKYEESIDYYKRAIAEDAKFGRAYSSWAVSAYSLGRRDEAEKLYKQAFALMDRMTEREKFRVYGTYALTITHNYQQAIDNYSKLLEKYPSDRAGHTNLAISYFYTMDFPRALEENRRAMDIYQGSFKLWSNQALYAMYAGDFATADKEASRVLQQSPTYYRAYLPRAMAALSRSDVDAAREAYAQMGKIDKQGASLAAMGVADLLLYQGNLIDAVSTLKAGIAEDEGIKSPAAVAAKSIALAEALEAQGQSKAAVAAVAQAMKAGRDESILVPAAGILLRSGNAVAAREIAGELQNRLQPQARAYAKVIEAEVAARGHHLGDAVEIFRGAQKLADLWLARFGLGVAYVEAGHYAEGLPELEACLKRRGEATAIFLNDVPSFRYLAPLHYWLARAQEGVGQRPAAMDNYKKFLALRPPTSKDPLAVDARKRVQ